MKKNDILFKYLCFALFIFCGIANAQTFTLDWSKNYGGSSLDFAEQINPTSDGGFVVIGRSSSSNGDVSENIGQSDYWLIKLDSNGNLQWQKTFGTVDSDLGKSVQQTSDGGYIVGGYTLKNGIYTGWILKLNNLGEIIWDKKLNNTLILNVQQVGNNNYLLSGSVDFKPALVKLDASGNILWEKQFANTANFTSVVETSTNYVGVTTDGNLYKISSTGDVVWQKSITNEIPIKVITTSDNKYLTIGTNNKVSFGYSVNQFNAQGDLEWNKSFESLLPNSFGNDIVEVSDGYVLLGISQDNISGTLDMNNTLVKIDKAGNYVWRKMAGGSKAEGSNNIFSKASIVKVSEGSYAVASSSMSSDRDLTANKGDFDFWVYKISSSAVQSVNDVSKNTFSVYPNPVVDFFSIKSDKKIASVEVYAADQRLIFTNNDIKDNKVSLESLSKGVYIVRFIDENKNIITKKIIKD